MRYLVELAYRGTPFVGWQRQSNGLSVQQCIEEALTKILQTQTKLVGCGRTDAGVHASRYYAHFDAHRKVSEQFIYKLNRLLPDEVAIKSVVKVNEDLHARFDAISRTYQYFITSKKDPFRQDLAYAFYAFHKLDRNKMDDAVAIVEKGRDFQAFCKTTSDTKHFFCDIKHARWTGSDHQLVFEICANRFLRGMVRLIVGMCLQIGLGKLGLEDVEMAINQQTPLSKPLSVPAHGLFLSEVRYPTTSVMAEIKTP